MEIDKERFKKLFPRLAEELKVEEQRIGITSVRSDPEAGEKAFSRKFAGYAPDVVDFIRRCDNEKQAEKVISHLKKRGEISYEYAKRLRRQLREKGVRSFGPKKEEDYYLKQGGL